MIVKLFLDHDADVQKEQVRDVPFLDVDDDDVTTLFEFDHWRFSRRQLFVDVLVEETALLEIKTTVCFQLMLTICENASMTKNVSVRLLNKTN